MRRLVSVIIPNHGRDIRKVLDAIDNSMYPYIETIVVDEGKERSVQRNIGIKRATGKYLLFLDSDMVIQPDLILDCTRRIKSCNGIYLREKIMTKGLFGRIRDWERQFYTGTVIDVVRFVLRENCPLFDESMSGPEDSDWDRQIPEPKTVTETYYEHYEDVSFISYFRKKAYYAKSMHKFEARNPNDKILDWKWRCFGVFVEQEKWKKLFHPFVCAVCFTVFIRGIIYLWNKR